MVKSATEQTNLGAFYTPEKTADYIVGRVGQSRLITANRIIEPAGGDGVFVRSLLKSGVDPSVIEVWDIDPDTEPAIDQLGASFSLGDTLARTIPEKSIDVVVGNPPYLNKRSSYIRANRSWLSKKFSEVGASETYTMFTYAMVRALRPGGRLGFILSDTFLSLGTHRRFREWLLNNVKIVEITLAPSRLFNAAVTTAIIIVERCEADEERNDNIVEFYSRRRDETEYGNGVGIAKVRQADLWRTPNRAFIPVEKSVLNLFSVHPALGEAGIDGHIGMHTKDNRRSLVAVEANGAEAAKQAAALKTGTLLPYIKTGGIADYWSPVREYLRWSGSMRKQYVMPAKNYFGKKGVAISGISSRLSARIMDAGCYWDTNKVMGFVNRTRYTDATVVGLLNSRLYNYIAKGILNTTSSIQIEDIRRIPLIDLSDDTAGKIDRLVKKIVLMLRSNSDADITPLRKEIDQLVTNASGISADAKEVIAGIEGGSSESRRRAA
jgi:adenine-specific DNA-methyltransferase